MSETYLFSFVEEVCLNWVGFFEAFPDHPNSFLVLLSIHQDVYQRTCEKFGVFSFGLAVKLRLDPEYIFELLEGEIFDCDMDAIISPRVEKLCKWYLLVDQGVFQNKKASFFLEVKVLAYSEKLINELHWIHVEILKIFFRKDVADKLSKGIYDAFWLLVLCELLLIIQILPEKHKEIYANLHSIDSVVKNLTAISLKGKLKVGLAKAFIRFFLELIVFEEVWQANDLVLPSLICTWIVCLALQSSSEHWDDIIAILANQLKVLSEKAKNVGDAFQDPLATVEVFCLHNFIVLDCFVLYGFSQGI